MILHIALLAWLLVGIAGLFVSHNRGRGVIDYNLRKMKCKICKVGEIEYSFLVDEVAGVMLHTWTCRKDGRRHNRIGECGFKMSAYDEDAYTKLLDPIVETVAAAPVIIDEYS